MNTDDFVPLNDIHSCENEVADQKAGESGKYHGGAHAPRSPTKSPKGGTDEVEGRREQRETPVHRLKDVIEKQRHTDHARDLDYARDRDHARGEHRPGIK